jgi:DNA replication and repair protein RecF
VRIERLERTDFRSSPVLTLEPPAGPQVLFGSNAAGKTNLLEALVLLARGGSHRASDAELVSWDAPFARVAARVGHPERPDEDVDVAISGTGTGGGVGIATGPRKRIRVNGVPRRAAALAATLRIVLFAPEEMLLVAGPPALRRAALDALAAGRSTAYGRSLATYGRALAQRNALLRQIRDEAAGRDQLAYWDAILVDEGGTIVAARLALLEDLAAPLAAAQSEIAPDEGTLTLAYQTNAPAAPGETPAQALRRRLDETADKEVWNGATLVGPHRDDLVFALDGRPLAAAGSRGQQRTAILALKLAELELLRGPHGEPPLLLLDDVFSELDPERRSHLVRRIESLPQAFVTTTALEDLDPALVARSTAWRVAPGSVAPAAVRSRG